MNEHYFLFAIALLWTLFATIQDIKHREVANWLNFSLLAFALSYRAFYSISTKQYQFFLVGILGFGVFFIIANILYYSNVFAGGDAKLLMSYGAIIPFTSYISVPIIALFFTLLLLTIGAGYSIVYSVGIISKNKKKFLKELETKIKKNKTLLTLSLIVFLISIILTTKSKIFVPLALTSIIPAIYLYSSSLEKCMIKLYPPSKLTEGDWLEKDVKIGRTTIKKTVHGLTKKDIAFLKKHRRSVFVKEGIPFTPAFLISLIVTIILFLKFPDFSFFLLRF
ncbi:prepilin peptidase [Candidatus Pacearchaeota archaeon]|nr:prepilin peptidase [Candidatus Pacearchaeota archaeon]